MENLNVKNMMKNRYLSKAIAEQNFYKFITYMKYKSEFNRIEFPKEKNYNMYRSLCWNLSLWRVISN